MTRPSFPLTRRLRRYASTCRLRRHYSAAALAALCIAAAPTVEATPLPGLIDADLVERMRQIVVNEVVTMSVASQNERYGKLTEHEIDSLDRQWVAEQKSGQKPLISATLANPLSNYLTRVQAHSIGLFAEIIIVDQNGLNVGQSNITSDFWQGDEAKYQRTYPEGPNALFIDEAEFEDETKTWRVQVNISIPDPDVPGVAIGAATFEVNLTELERRIAP